MKLLSLQLRHVGPFREAIEVPAFQEGINILGAPNESGKSTLIKAAARGLFDRHTCKDSEIKTLQPVGTDLSPHVMVGFETSEGRFRIGKTFLNSPKSELWRWIETSWQIEAEGDRADRKVQELMMSKQPGRGATTAAHWGLMNYLWARQGQEIAWPEWGDEAGERIREQLARVTLDPLVDGLREQLLAAWGGSYTGTGQIRKGGPLHLAQQEVEALGLELKEIRDSMGQLEALRKQFQSAKEELAGLEEEASEKRKVAQVIRVSAQKAELVQTELRALKSELENARKGLEQVSDDQDSIASAQKKIREVESQLATNGEKLTRLEAEEKRRREQLHESEKSLETAKHAQRALRGRWDRIRGLMDWFGLRRQLGDLQKTLDLAREKQARIQEIQAQLEALPEVKSGGLKQLESIERDIQKAQIQIEALGLNVTVIPERDSVIHAVVDEKEERIEISANEEKSLAAPQTLTLKLEGWGKVSVRSGATEVKQLIKRQENLLNEFNQLRESYEVSSVEDARLAFRQRKDLKSELKLNETSLNSLLGEAESIGSLEGALEKMGAKCEKWEVELGLEGEAKPDSGADIEAEEEALKQRWLRGEAENELTEAAIKKSRKKGQAAAEAVVDARQEITSKQSELDHLRQQVEQVQGRYADGLENSRKGAQQRFVESEARLEAKQRELPEGFEKLSERNRRASAAAVEIEGRRNELSRTLEQLRGSLATLGAAGFYSRETELLEQLQTARERLARVRLDGQSSRLAHALIERRKLEATRTVLEPLEDRLSSLFGKITGMNERRVFLGDHLNLMGVGRDSRHAVPFRLLSQGAKEQLLLCLRMAVATELSEKESQVLILDDVLVNTDRSRQERTLDLLMGLGAQVQVVILTCHPERYRGVGTTHRL